MKLTRGEFCQFNLKSRMFLLKDYGTLVLTKKLDTFHEIRLFLVNDFYVEVLGNYKQNEVIKIEPSLHRNWTSLLTD